MFCIHFRIAIHAASGEVLAMRQSYIPRVSGRADYCLLSLDYAHLRILFIAVSLWLCWIKGTSVLSGDAQVVLSSLYSVTCHRLWFLHSHGELCSSLLLACSVFVVKLCWPLISQVPYVSVHGSRFGDPWETCQRPSCVFILYACEEVMLDILWPCIPCVWRGCAGDVAAIRCMSVKPWSSSCGLYCSELSILFITVNLRLCQIKAALVLCVVPVSLFWCWFSGATLVFRRLLSAVLLPLTWWAVCYLCLCTVARVVFKFLLWSCAGHLAAKYPVFLGSGPYYSHLSDTSRRCHCILYASTKAVQVMQPEYVTLLGCWRFIRHSIFYEFQA